MSNSCWVTSPVISRLAKWEKTRVGDWTAVFPSATSTGTPEAGGWIDCVLTYYTANGVPGAADADEEGVGKEDKWNGITRVTLTPLTVGWDKLSEYDETHPKAMVDTTRPLGVRLVSATYSGEGTVISVDEDTAFKANERIPFEVPLCCAYIPPQLLSDADTDTTRSWNLDTTTRQELLTWAAAAFCVSPTQNGAAVCGQGVYSKRNGTVLNAQRCLNPIPAVDPGTMFRFTNPAVLSLLEVTQSNGHSVPTCKVLPKKPSEKDLLLESCLSFQETQYYPNWINQQEITLDQPIGIPFWGTLQFQAPPKFADGTLQVLSSNGTSLRVSVLSANTNLQLLVRLPVTTTPN